MTASKPKMRVLKTYDELKNEFGDRYQEYETSWGGNDILQRVLDNTAVYDDERIFKYVDDPSFKEIGNNLYQRDFFTTPEYDEVGQLRYAGGERIRSEYFFNDKKLDKSSALNLIKSGVNVPYEALKNLGFGGSDNHKFAHVRSPAAAALEDQFDSNYGTKGQRQIAYAFADKAGIDRKVVDKIAGQEFAAALENGSYNVYDKNSLNSIGNKTLDFIGKQSGFEIPQEARDTLQNYNNQIFELTNIPHTKKSGFIKQSVSDFTGGVLGLGESLLKPIGLEKFAAPIIGAGITAASGGTLGTVGSAIAGGAFAGGAQPIAAGDFSAGLKGAALGGAAGGLGGLASTVNPVTSLGSQGNLIANQAVQGGIGGAAGGLLSGQNPIKSGLLSAATSGAVAAGSVGIQSGINAIKDRFSNAGSRVVNTGFSPSTSLAGDGAPTQPGINQSRFNPRTIGADGLSPELGGVGLRPSTLPMLGGMGNGVGLVSALRDRNGNVVAYQGVNGIVRPGFVNAIGDINSYINDPNLQGRDVVQAGQVRNFGVTPPVRSELSDKAAERLLGGLLGGGAIAAGAGLLGGDSGSGGGIASRPLTQFQINPQVNKYTGDFETFGERGSGGFRFYNAPVTGLLG